MKRRKQEDVGMDGVMNEFLFRCRHPLVPLPFHEVTSLHPPSFQRNNFSTCLTYSSVWGKASIKMKSTEVQNYRRIATVHQVNNARLLATQRDVALL